MPRPARITIHSMALRHNLEVAKRTAPDSKVMVAVKADAYGHGMVSTAEILQESTDGFIVACLSEALRLREHNIDLPIVVIQGAQRLEDFTIASEKRIHLVIHDEYQLQLLDRLVSASITIPVALKLDTGMHRLGLPCVQAQAIYTKLQSHPNIDPDIWLMTHLACADELDNDYTSVQIGHFNQYTNAIDAPKTIANSAGILAWPDSHRDWIRPGIMIYGSSPFINMNRADLDLQATMTLTAPVIAIHNLKQGDAIGYGSTWTCPRDMTVGVIACGYADGYPRHAPSGTPVWLNEKITQTLGRISMDLIVIDLTQLPAKIGDLAELWGKNNNIDLVAQSAKTISYELLCHAGNSCQKNFEPS